MKHIRNLGKNREIKQENVNFIVLPLLKIPQILQTNPIPKKLKQHLNFRMHIIYYLQVQFPHLPQFAPILHELFTLISLKLEPIKEFDEILAVNRFQVESCAFVREIYRLAFGLGAHLKGVEFGKEFVQFLS